MEDLISTEQSVKFIPATVNFTQYETMLCQARAIADEISGIKVTEENLQAVKKDLARVRKASAELNARRIEIKNMILKDYTVFENQVKEIDGILSEAEDVVRSQTRRLEEAERNAKMEQIRETWDKRIWQFRIGKYDGMFDRWITPQMLNKATSMKSIITNMTEWLSKREEDLELLEGMDDDYTVEYLKTLDLTKAIDTVNKNEAMKQLIKPDPEEVTEETAIFVITGKKNIKLVEMLLNENEIDYRRTK